MNISQGMKHNVVLIPETSTIRETPAMFTKAHAGLLPVLDKDNTISLRALGVAKRVSKKPSSHREH